MDIICLFPNYIKSDDFFSKFKDELKKVGVKNVLEIVDARVPILKFKINDLDIDFRSYSSSYKYKNYAFMYVENCNIL